MYVYYFLWYKNAMNKALLLVKDKLHLFVFYFQLSKCMAMLKIIYFTLFRLHITVLHILSDYQIYINIVAHTFCPHDSEC